MVNKNLAYVLTGNKNIMKAKKQDCNWLKKEDSLRIQDRKYRFKLPHIPLFCQDDLQTGGNIVRILADI